MGTKQDHEDIMAFEMMLGVGDDLRPYRTTQMPVDIPRDPTIGEIFSGEAIKAGHLGVVVSISSRIGDIQVQPIKENARLYISRLAEVIYFGKGCSEE